MTIRSDIWVDFSSSPRIVWVTAPSTELVIQDLVDTLRSIEAELVNISQPSLLSASGKDPLGGGVSVGITTALKNAQVAFEGRSGPAFTQCSVAGGNLVSFDAMGTNISSIHATSFTQVLLTSSSSATLQDLKSLQLSSFAGTVTIDQQNGFSGTQFPTGTNERPVNNITDALFIAGERGLRNLLFKGQTLLTSGDDVSYFVLSGENAIATMLAIQTEAVVNNCQFEDMFITNSVFDGYTYLKHCAVNSVSGFVGFMEGCLISGNIQLAGSMNTYFVDCKSGCVGLETTDLPVLDMNGGNKHVAFRNYGGPIKIINCNDPTNTICLDITSGATIILDSSCTAGTVFVRGIANVQNTSTLTIHSDAQLNTQGIIDAVWSANTSSYVVPGSMGYAQSQVSGLSSNQANMLLEMYELLGLDPTKPLTVTHTTRTAGLISQTISSNDVQTVVSRV